MGEDRRVGRCASTEYGSSKAAQLGASKPPCQFQDSLSYSFDTDGRRVLVSDSPNSSLIRITLSRFAVTSVDGMIRIPFFSLISKLLLSSLRPRTPSIFTFAFSS